MLTTIGPCYVRRQVQVDEQRALRLAAEDAVQAAARREQEVRLHHGRLIALPMECFHQFKIACSMLVWRLHVSSQDPGYIYIGAGCHYLHKQSGSVQGLCLAPACATHLVGSNLLFMVQDFEQDDV